MPQQIICSDCGCVLYEGEVIKSPYEIIRKFNSRCPKCNRKLSFSPENVKVVLWDGGSDASKSNDR
ncbi:MAG: hypothetical protein QXD04_02150 [Candidatus Bathyarchaeia archaeon]|nr:hypothetical protein [Candidatus Bathyarchaeota archaeon]